jgi:hypothetical protein
VDLDFPSHEGDLKHIVGGLKMTIPANARCDNVEGLRAFN